MKLALVALLLAFPLCAVAVEPPTEAKMQQQREKAMQWSARGLSCDQVIANLRGWYGRLFEGVSDPAAGTCDVYVVTHQWINSLKRLELVHRQRIVTVPM